MNSEYRHGLEDREQARQQEEWRISNLNLILPWLSKGQESRLLRLIELVRYLPFIFSSGDFCWGGLYSIEGGRVRIDSFVCRLPLPLPIAPRNGLILLRLLALLLLIFLLYCSLL